MRKLDRTAVPPPPCLAEYKHGRDRWDETVNRPEIRAHLNRMQGRRCAYCEGPLDDHKQHIEHFRTRSRFPKLMFEWRNLYLSCAQVDSCGIYKDHSAGAHDPDDLIDPCIDDPDRFFRFYSNGAIKVRQGLSPADARRAHETLRVFNLNPEHGSLRARRQRAAKDYLARDPRILDDLREFSEDDRRDYIAEELRRTADEPFSTVIRHLFEGLA
jgi:uncharacterized protein (TIGR02646 family)